jgi:hypothetical protein
MVWVHLREDRFPLLRRSKLRPRGASPYRVLAKINDNAYSCGVVNILQGLRAVALVSGFKRGEFIGDTKLSRTIIHCHHHHRIAHEKIGPPHIARIVHTGALSLFGLLAYRNLSSLFRVISYVCFIAFGGCFVSQSGWWRGQWKWRQGQVKLAEREVWCGRMARLEDG